MPFAPNLDCKHISRYTVLDHPALVNKPHLAKWVLDNCLSLSKESRKKLEGSV